MGNQNAKVQKELTPLLKELSSKVAELEKLEEREAKWKATEQKVEEHLLQICDTVTLNFGGTIFQVSKETLTRVKDTFFYVMLASGRWSAKESGVYIIDRSPHYFTRILDYLRTGELRTADLSMEEKEELFEELDFYVIPRTVEVKWSLRHCGWNVYIDMCGTMARKVVGRTEAVLGTLPVTSVTFKILYVEEGSVFVGLSEQASFDKYSHNELAYVLSVGSGVFYSRKDYQKKLFEGLKEGDSVVVVHNREEKTVSFGVNDRRPVVAQRNVDGELYPYTVFNGKGAVQIIRSFSL